MRRNLFLLPVPVALCTLLAGCGNTMIHSVPAQGNVPVSLSMTDDPPQGVAVLFFQVSLTGATLTSSSGTTVSLLNNNTPIQIDVTELQALSAFLSTADLTAGTTYDSLSLTFASPELVIFNASDTSLGSSCAVGSICQLAPSFDGSTTLNFTSSPFPVTMAANSPLGFLVDFHLNKVIQPDLSVNLGVANGITVAELPSMPHHPQFGNVTGEVESVDPAKNEFTILTTWGRTFTIDTTSSTTFDDFPVSACTTAGIGCVANAQVVQVQVAGVASKGVLTASQVTYEQAGGTQTVEGTILDILPLPTPAGEEVVQMLLHRTPNAASDVPMGGVATVTFVSGAAYSIDNNGFTIPSGLTFTGTADVYPGQTVSVAIDQGTLQSGGGGNWGGGWGPPSTVSFSSNSVALEPTQVTGRITALDSTDQSFTLGFNLPGFIPFPNLPSAFNFDVLTTSQTAYQGFNPESFDGLATQQFVSVDGWLFPPVSTGPPQVAAQSVVSHSNGWF